MHQPQLLLLDEPTAGVDPKARREFWDEIHRLAEEGLTVLVSTHYMDEAERCHRIVYIAYGTIVARGTAPRRSSSSPGSHTFVVTGRGDARRGARACKACRASSRSPPSARTSMSSAPTRALERSVARRSPERFAVKVAPGETSSRTSSSA